MLLEIEIHDYLQIINTTPLIDVRSPGEFTKGHIPCAKSIPLFSDEERAKVGTVYKKQSKEKAIELGYKFVNPKLENFISEAKKVAKGGSKIAVHCWRGGMRSQAFAKHLETNGFEEVYVIKGGYKSFRNHALNAFKQPAEIRILGGYTGSGKTYLLYELQNRGYQIIDLEGLAKHKGSAFGNIDFHPQPTIEQFENDLFWEWKELNLSKTIWIEDESHRIGTVNIPMNLYNQMRDTPVYFLDIPKEERAIHLVDEYADSNPEDLANAINRISKRLGGQNTKIALGNLGQNNFYDVAILSLQYYDKYYLRGLATRDQKLVHTLKIKNVNHTENAQLLHNYYESI